MRAALGLKTHSGWAALVVLGRERETYRVVERRRIELITERDPDWPGQPYHAAQNKPIALARRIVERGIADADACARAELRDVLARVREAGIDVVVCAVLTPAPLPDWTLEQILAVHLRLHQAEGALYPAALLRAAEACGLPAQAIAQKTLTQVVAQQASAKSSAAVVRQIAELGKSIGAPWGADQKQAALAAWLALEGRRVG
jgi:hypothetical protein